MSNVATPDEDRYVFLKGAFQDLSRARAILEDLGKPATGSSSVLARAAYHFAIVLYCNPYSGNRGHIKREHRLDPSCVPTGQSAIHRCLVETRDQFLAHSDVTPKQASIYYPSIGGEPVIVEDCNDDNLFPVSLSAFSDLVDQTVAGVRAELKRVEAAL